MLRNFAKFDGGKLPISRKAVHFAVSLGQSGLVTVFSVYRFGTIYNCVACP